MPSALAAPAKTWQFYLSPPEAWEAMLAACESAQCTIECEQYIFEPDAIGERFADVFVRKVSEGVRVRLLCDGIGSFSLINSPLAKRCEAAGVEIRFYNRVHVWKLRRVMAYVLRDHRKLLVVDSRTGYIGGVGIASYMDTWRDTHMRAEGAVVEEMADSFETMWRVANHERGAHMRTPLVPEPSFRILNNAPRFRHRHIYHLLLRSIAAARTRVYVSTAYFVPSVRLTRALRKAAKRGVDVRIADIAARSYFSRLLRAGVKIYEYQASMFHPKTVVVDDTLGMAGSANIDNLSLLLNYETNLVSTEPQFIAELVEHFENDLPRSREIALPEWKTRSFLQKCKELFVQPLRGIL